MTLSLVACRRARLWARGLEVIAGSLERSCTLPRSVVGLKDEAVAVAEATERPAATLKSRAASFMLTDSVDRLGATMKARLVVCRVDIEDKSPYMVL